VRLPAQFVDATDTVPPRSDESSGPSSRMIGGTAPLIQE
jgi:hypothetical protein